MPYEVRKVGSRFKVFDDKGRAYSKKGLTKAQARKQQQALYASAFHGSGYCSYSDDDGHHILIEGGGFFSDIFSKARRIATQAVKAPATVVQNVVGRIKDVAQGIRTDYPPDVRDVLAKYGNSIVEKLLIRREPIQSFINQALNFISLGKWNEARKELNYDKLYHLSMIATLKMPNGSQAELMIEKNEVINITPNFSMRGKMDLFPIQVSIPITLKQMLDKAQELQGDRFFLYDAFTNNCQMFLQGILDANGLSTPKSTAFILQDVETLLQRVPKIVSPFAKALTNVAGLFNVALKGRGDIMMNPKDYFAEHKKIIALLNDIAKKAKAEADEQAGEVKAQKKKRKLKGGVGAEGFEEALATTGLTEPSDDPYAKKINDNTFEIISKPTDVIKFDEAKYNQMTSRGLSKEAYEAKQAKKKTPGKSYEDYRKSLEDISRARATTNQSSVERANKQAEKQKNILDYYNEYIRLNPQLENVLCYADEKGDYVPGGKEVPRYKCDAYNKARQRKEYGSTFFGKINNALIDVGDFLVDNIGSKLPGVGKYVAEAYKMFAPPGSKFSGGSKEKWIQEVVKHIKEGAFTKQAKREGLEPEEFAEKVLANPKKYQLTTRRRAQFLVNLLKKKSKGGGRLVPSELSKDDTIGTSPQFENQLKGYDKAGLTPEVYLTKVRYIGMIKGFDPEDIRLATDGKHKIAVKRPDGKYSLAGAVGHPDYIIWTTLEHAGLAPEGTAVRKRNEYRARAMKIKGKWKKDKYSPNNLAINLLWSTSRVPKYAELRSFEQRMDTRFDKIKEREKAVKEKTENIPTWLKKQGEKEEKKAKKELEKSKKKVIQEEE